VTVPTGSSPTTQAAASPKKSATSDTTASLTAGDRAQASQTKFTGVTSGSGGINAQDPAAAAGASLSENQKATLSAAAETLANAEVKLADNPSDKAALSARDTAQSQFDSAISAGGPGAPAANERSAGPNFSRVKADLSAIAVNHSKSYGLGALFKAMARAIGGREKEISQLRNKLGAPISRNSGRPQAPSAQHAASQNKLASLETSLALLIKRFAEIKNKAPHFQPLPSYH
jgi:hypothetical protein